MAKRFQRPKPPDARSRVTVEERPTPPDQPTPAPPAAPPRRVGYLRQHVWAEVPARRTRPPGYPRLFLLGGLVWSTTVLVLLLTSVLLAFGVDEIFGVETSLIVLVSAGITLAGVLTTAALVWLDRT